MTRNFAAPVFIACGLTLTSAMLAQTVATGPITTPGKCSFVVIQPKASVSLTCEQKGMTAEERKKQAEEYVKILTVIRENGLKSDTVINKLAAMASDITDIRNATAKRRLTEMQKEALQAAAIPFAGQKVSMAVTLGDVEAIGYANDFLDILRAAKWTGLEGTGYDQVVFTQPQLGVKFLVSAATVNASSLPPHCAALYNFLQSNQILTAIPTRTQDIAEGTCRLLIGTR